MIQELKNVIEYKEKFVGEITEEIKTIRISKQIKEKSFQEKIREFQKKIEEQVCSTIPTAFWYKKKHEVSLPYVKDFDERKFSTKARPIKMNQRLLEICIQEIKELQEKNLIRPSSSPWSCAAFYVENTVELERGVPRLVINYKPLNKVLQWIRYPIPNKQDLIKRTQGAKIFSKFDIKSGFWQIQIKEEDRYKTTFTVPFGHFE